MNSTSRRRSRPKTSARTRRHHTSRGGRYRHTFHTGFSNPTPTARPPAGTGAAVSPVLPTWKRALDILLVLILLPLLVVAGLFIYAWIRIFSPGSVLFTQDRVGLNGKTFKLYKFRSMVPGAPTAIHEDYVSERMRSGKPMPKLDFSGDKRLIKGGRWMRMTAADELPQLINVLRGEMSLVGPRPCTVAEYAGYRVEQRRRFQVLPGLTGLWQVQRTTSTTFPEMLRLDEEYVAKRSLALDLRILFLTPGSLIAQIRECRSGGRSQFANTGSGFPHTAGIGHKS